MPDARGADRADGSRREESLRLDFRPSLRRRAPTAAANRNDRCAGSLAGWRRTPPPDGGQPVSQAPEACTKLITLRRALAQNPGEPEGARLVRILELPRRVEIFSNVFAWVAGSLLFGLDRPICPPMLPLTKS